MRVPIRLGLTGALAVFAIMSVAASSALAAGESHPKVGEFGSFTKPNGIAVDEASGDVYVADLGTNTIYKFDSSDNPVNFTEGAGLGTNALTGTETPGGSFQFPMTEPGNPAAIAVDNSTDPADPSAGDLYVMDADHNVIDKFNSKGKYLNQITGPFSAGQLVGLGVDTGGEVRVGVNAGPDVHPTDVFDDASVNSFVEELIPAGNVINEIESADVYGFATSAQPGSDYQLLSCGCVAKLGPDGEELGQVDDASGAVALAVSPVSGHVYIDDQSSVSEWDTGQMNAGETGGMASGTGALVSTFGSTELSPSSGQGGIAVDGATGKIYVSNPANGKVYVFATTVPAVFAGTPTGVTTTDATLHATVNPRGGEATSCRFEYDTSPSNNLTAPPAHLEHIVPCEQTQAQIGAGTQPVPVSAQLTGLQPGSLYYFRLVAANANGSAPSGGIFPTAAPGFAIKNFEVAFLNQDGTPDTQAGSHPYKMVTVIEFNKQVIRRAPNNLVYITMPVGNVKDLTIDFPPGLFGDSNATARKCTLEELSSGGLGDECPVESEVGTNTAEIHEGVGVPRLNPEVVGSRMVSMSPPHGVPFQLAAHILLPNAFINVGLPPGGDARLQATALGIPVTAPIYKTLTTIFGVPPHGATRPLLTLPTACNGPLTSNIFADSYQEPGRMNLDGTPDLTDPRWKTAESVTLNLAGSPGGMTGCSKLVFPPTIATVPDTTNASTSSGLTVGLKVPQTAAFNPTGLAESGVRNLTVALPAGFALNPADADGLEACSEGLAGFTGFTAFNPDIEPGDETATFTKELPTPLLPGANFCPNGSKIGTVKIKTPLLPNPLEGTVYLAAQEANPFGGLLAMYLIAEDPVSGTIVKQTGRVSLCENAGELLDGVTCEAPSQIIATFKNIPDDPFEEAELHFFGGERAPLRTPSRCGTYTTKATFTPWDGNGPVDATSSFRIEHGPNGGPCPGASLPFAPSANAGSTNLQAGEFSPFTLSMIRHDGEQNLQSVTATLPPGLSGMLSNIELCPEPQANEGTCPAGSQIGETTVRVGVGSEPFTVTGGRDYLTGPYNGTGGCAMGTPGCAPFGLTFEVPAKAGPFDFEKTAKHSPACDCLVVRGKIEINPITSALTITSDPPGSPHAIPTMLEGIPLEIQQVNATTTRSNFQFNPTNCAKTNLAGTLYSSEKAQDTISLPYQVTNCAALKFEPKLSVSTSGKTSKANGASLTAKVTTPKVPQGTDADIAKVKVELPRQLPSRLTTLQKACTAKQFEANPAACPPESKIGYAVVRTPILPVPLEGPAIFVSHGGEAFPSLTMVLQGDNVTIDLVGTTFISKAGITSTTFKTLPDQPFSTFELTLPEGKFSALTANANLCSPTRTVLVKRKVTVRVRGHKKTVTRKVRETVSAPLTMPTEFVGQNGAVIKNTTKIAVTGCPKVKKAKKVKKTKKKASSSHGHGRRAATKR